jgi:cell division protease FtsH
LSVALAAGAYTINACRRPDASGDKESKLKQSHKTILMWLVLFAIVVIVIQIVTGETRSTEDVAFSTMRRAVEADAIESVTVHADGRIEGTFREDAVEEFGSGNAEFSTVGRVSDDLEDMMVLRGVELTFEREEPNIWQPMLTVGIPLIIVTLIVVFATRQLQGGGGRAMSFGKSKAKLLNESQNKVTFDDIAGIEEAKAELQEIVEFLRDPKKFTRLGGRIPKGVLLMGSPGTGKTLLARGVAGEAGVPFFSISGSDFVEMFVGVGASRVRDLFEQGKKQAPCIIFIDEIDAVGRHRGAGMGGGHDEREQTLNQLLVEMDGFESNEGVILIAATNRPDVLDPALLRPGRFDRHVVVPRPDVAGREGILGVHMRKTPLAPDVSVKNIARGTPGFSGADLENLVNEAALIAARKNKDRIDNEDFEEAKDKVMMGAERKSAIISDREKKVTAYHEAGHALVAALLPQGREVDPVHKVTIIPRGRALGMVQQLPAEDRLNYSRSFAMNRIAIAMGGRAAEEIIFDQITTGAGSDLQQATNMARRMVCEWGMSDAIGPINFGGDDSEVFLGRDYNRQSRPYSEQTAILIDHEIQRIVKTQYDLARRLLDDNVQLLHDLTESLLEFETLDLPEVELVLEGKSDELRRLRARRNSEAANRRPPARGFTTADAEERPRAADVRGLSPATAAGGADV